MMKRKPTTQILDPKLFGEIRKIAKDRGMKIYAVIEDAFRAYLEKQK